MTFGVAMDQIDARILEALQEDARCSRAALARRIGMSPAAVHERVKRLERSGLITGYHAHLDPALAGSDLLTYVEVFIDPPAQEAAFLESMAGRPEVQEIHDVTGEFTCLLKVRTRDRESLRRFLIDRLNVQEGVRRTRTTLVLSTSKESHRILLPGETSPRGDRP
jgi:Lrp/AsnC family leucine-responsive transcriptional regulator